MSDLLDSTSLILVKRAHSASTLVGYIAEYGEPIWDEENGRLYIGDGSSSPGVLVNIIDEEAPPHVLATNTGLGVSHTISCDGSGQVLISDSANTAKFAYLNYEDMQIGIHNVTEHLSSYPFSIFYSDQRESDSEVIEYYGDTTSYKVWTLEYGGLTVSGGEKYVLTVDEGDVNGDTTTRLSFQEINSIFGSHSIMSHTGTANRLVYVNSGGTMTALAIPSTQNSFLRTGASNVLAFDTLRLEYIADTALNGSIIIYNNSTGKWVKQENFRNYFVASSSTRPPYWVLLADSTSYDTAGAWLAKMGTGITKVKESRFKFGGTSAYASDTYTPTTLQINGSTLSQLRMDSSGPAGLYSAIFGVQNYFSGTDNYRFYNPYIQRKFFISTNTYSIDDNLQSTAMDFLIYTRTCVASYGPNSTTLDTTLDLQTTHDFKFDTEGCFHIYKPYRNQTASSPTDSLAALRIGTIDHIVTVQNRDTEGILIEQVNKTMPSVGGGTTYGDVAGLRIKLVQKVKSSGSGSGAVDTDYISGVWLDEVSGDAPVAAYKCDTVESLGIAYGLKLGTISSIGSYAGGIMISSVDSGNAQGYGVHVDSVIASGNAFGFKINSVDSTNTVTGGNAVGLYIGPMSTGVTKKSKYSIYISTSDAEVPTDLDYKDSTHTYCFYAEASTGILSVADGLYVGGNDETIIDGAFTFNNDGTFGGDLYFNSSVLTFVDSRLSIKQTTETGDGAISIISRDTDTQYLRFYGGTSTSPPWIDGKPTHIDVGSYCFLNGNWYISGLFSFGPAAVFINTVTSDTAVYYNSNTLTIETDHNDLTSGIITFGASTTGININKIVAKDPVNKPFKNGTILIFVGATVSSTINKISETVADALDGRIKLTGGTSGNTPAAGTDWNAVQDAQIVLMYCSITAEVGGAQGFWREISRSTRTAS